MGKMLKLKFAMSQTLTQPRHCEEHGPLSRAKAPQRCRRADEATQSGLAGRTGALSTKEARHV